MVDEGSEPPRSSGGSPGFPPGDAPPSFLRPPSAEPEIPAAAPEMEVGGGGIPPSGSLSEVPGDAEPSSVPSVTEPQRSEADDVPLFEQVVRERVRQVAAVHPQSLVWRMPAIAVPVTVEAVVLTVVMGLVFLVFLLIAPTPRWLALCGAILAALGADGVLRTARRAEFEMAGTDTTPYLFLPALFALAVPAFIEYNLRGYWLVPAGLLAALGFGVVVVCEVASVREGEPLRNAARFLASAATYVVVFALFSLAYAFDLDLRAAVVAIGLSTVLLAVELLRDDQIDPLETLVFAAVIGVVLAEVRWVLQYMPIDGYPAGLVLLLGFYFLTGLVHAYTTRQLDLVVAGEYAGVAVIGVVLVAGARVAGLA